MAAVGLLADLDEIEHRVLVHSLEGVPGGSRIDIPKLLASVKAEATEQRRREAEQLRANANPGRYESHLRAQGWRPSCEREGAAPVKPTKRPIRRLRPQPAETAAEESNGAADRVAEPKREKSVTQPLSRPQAYVGPRAFDGHGSITPERPIFVRPPWLIPDNPEAD